MMEAAERITEYCASAVNAISTIPGNHCTGRKTNTFTAVSINRWSNGHYSEALHKSFTWTIADIVADPLLWVSLMHTCIVLKIDQRPATVLKTFKGYRLWQILDTSLSIYLEELLLNRWHVGKHHRVWIHLLHSLNICTKIKQFTNHHAESHILL